MRYKMSDDEPALSGGDKLHFNRYLNVIEKRVLHRTEATPFVVGIYGSWGSGKTTMMSMIIERLLSEEFSGKWEIVQFSPWMYRHEKSLLLPLLATIAKNRPIFQKMLQEVIDSGPSVIKLLSSINPVAKAGLPLVTFLEEIRKKKEKAKDFGEKVADAVRDLTSCNKKMVFFIDDLDRCHDYKQIIGLLEQIKLFLHIDRCLFFIGADKDQIVKAIERQFPGEGVNYLDKFIQLPFELPQHHGHHLVDVLGDVEPELRRYLVLISDVLGNNPRKLKKIWNEAVVGLEVVREEIGRVSRVYEPPIIQCMLKWLLLSQCAPLKQNPYLYLKYERAAAEGRSIDIGALNAELGLKDSGGTWCSDMHRRLSIFICQDIQRHRFYSPSRLSLYAKASGEDVSRSRTMVEAKVFGGKAYFSSEDFTDSDLSYGMFAGAVFEDCTFVNTVFKETSLCGVTFLKCDLKAACFDNAELKGTTFKNCSNVDALNTEPFQYQVIADIIIASQTGAVGIEGDEGVFKMFRTILELHREAGSLTSAIETELREKGKKARDSIEQGVR